MKKVPKVMVCVTRQKTCERLIRVGERIARENNYELSVVHVVKIGVNFLGNPDEGEALDYLFSVSKKAGADMTVLRSENVLNSLVEYAENNGISEIVLGQSPKSQSDTNIMKQLEQKLPGIKFRIVPS